MYKSSNLTETKAFACIADGVAHYYDRGFQAFDDTNEDRLMRTETQEVWIRHHGKTPEERFLNVKATVIDL